MTPTCLEDTCPAQCKGSQLSSVGAQVYTDTPTHTKTHMLYITAHTLGSHTLLDS